MWRLIYTDKRICDLFEVNGTTYTKDHLYDAETIWYCFDKIDELKYTYMYPTGDTKVIIFSAGTRTIVDEPEN